MLKKLIKYDLIWINKILVFFYVIAFVFAIIGRLLSLIENSIFFDILSKICNGITISFVINAIVNGIIRSWVRFVNNCYKDESYLTHTLPISKTQIYFSKFISSILTIAIAGVFAIGSLAICYAGPELVKLIKQVFNFAETQNVNITLIIFLIVTLLIVELITMISVGFIGIIIGNRYNSKKFLKSVIAGFSCYMGITFIFLIFILIASIFNVNLKTFIFDSSNLASLSITSQFVVNILIVFIILYILAIVLINYFANKLFNKGVNID